MSATLRFTILGCGSSGGVPRIGGHWGACDPMNPKNRRRRCAMLVERVAETGVTRLLIDTGPDLREQLIDTQVSTLDAVLYTHGHADHVHGIDDLRQVVINMRARLPVWADGATQERLYGSFGYAFVQPADSAYPPILDMHTIKGPFTIEGAGGAIEITPFTAHHGTIDALGFRIGGLAYLPDAVEIPEASWPTLVGLDVWVVDCLRYTPHPTHAHLEMALDWIARAQPKEAILTNMHIDLDYARLASELPAGISPAYDGRVIELPAP